MLAPFNVMVISDFSKSEYLKEVLFSQDLNTYFVDNLRDAISYVHTTDCIIFDDEKEYINILKNLPNDEYSPYKIMLSSEHAFSKLNNLLNNIGITKLVEKPIDSKTLINAVEEAKDFMGILRNNIKLTKVLLEKREDLNKVRQLNEVQGIQRQEELLELRKKINQVQGELKTIQLLMMKTINIDNIEQLERLCQISLLRHFKNIDILITDKQKTENAYSLPLVSGGYVLGRVYFKNITPTSEQEDFLRKISGILAIAYDKLKRFSVLEQKKQYWEKIFDAIPLAICFSDTKGFVLRGNKVFAKIFNLEIKEIVGMNLSSLFSSENEQSSQNRERIYQIRLKDEKYEVKEASYSDLDGYVYNVSIFKNITKETKYKEQLRISERFSELGILSGSVAHEINNIVGGVSSLLQILLEEEDMEDLKEDLSEMYNASKRSKEIAINLLNFSRQTRQVDKQEIYVQELIKTMLQFAVLQIKHENIEIDAKLSEEAIFIETYFNDFMQGILNIINMSINSIKQNRNSLHEEGIIGLSLERKKDNGVITITDNGKNPKIDTPSIFITRQILESLGGFLDIDAKNNRYTLVFKIKK